MHGRILVIHDVPAIREVVSRALEAEGGTAIGVEDFRTAHECPGGDPPQVIITDERLIDGDPTGFCAMRAHFPGSVVLAFVAPVRTRRTGVRHHVECELEKPPRDDQVIRAVEWALQLFDSSPSAAPG